MISLVTMLSGAARVGTIAAEQDCCGDCSQPQHAESKKAPGSQGCALHKLPRQLCVDHRFVRLNYARRPAMSRWSYIAHPEGLCFGGCFRSYLWLSYCNQEVFSPLGPTDRPEESG